MRTGPRLMWALTMGAFLMMSSGCASTNLRLVEDELARGGTGLLKKDGQNIEGYLLRDGTRVEYKGMVRLASQDSLSFWKKINTELDGGGVEGDVAVISKLEPGPVYILDAVKALDVKEAKVGATVLLVCGTIIGVFGVMFATAPVKFASQ